ncbi:hypothetical protein AAFF_G00283970 [Aldrovandia affinis]|uniref:Uncharacterized protein n=1 Tax=Aldrovandia affinis TaxID=143900 RepID=A0AAD7TA48_9TELE|nr:hypothetical protein AAFF_G00283970 [Aldrovandia affinis]
MVLLGRALPSPRLLERIPSLWLRMGGGGRALAAVQAGAGGRCREAAAEAGRLSRALLELCQPRGPPGTWTHPLRRLPRYLAGAAGSQRVTGRALPRPSIPSATRASWQTECIAGAKWLAEDREAIL